MTTLNPKNSDLENTTQLEMRSIDFVPHDERNAKLSSQGPFWFLGNFHFFTISIGFVGVAMGLTAGWTALAGLLGIMFGTLFMAFHGSQGPEMGLPQMIQSRAQFGFRGVTLALLAALFVFVGFDVVNITLLMSGINGVFGVEPVVTACVTILLGAGLAVLGHDWMHKGFKWALYLSLPLYGFISLAAFLGLVPATVAPAAATTPVAALGFSWVAFFTQFAISASYNISYAPYVSDYSRYLPHNTSRTKIIAALFVGASLSGAWMIGLGAWMAQHLMAADALVALQITGDAVVPGLGKLIVVVSVLAFLPIIGLNLYSGGLTLLTIVDSLHRINPNPRARVIAVLVLAAFVLFIALAIQGAAISVLNIFLVFMLYFLIPWSAVNLVDYFFVRKGQYAIEHLFTPNGIYGAWGMRGIISYVVGFICMVPFFFVMDVSTGKVIYEGAIASALQGVDIAWLVGLIVSGAVYYVLSRSLDLNHERNVIARLLSEGKQ